MSTANDSSIPPALLQRLIQEFVADKKTKLTQPALNALGEYFSTFIREAIWRAAQVRKGDVEDPEDPDSVGSKVLGSGAVFLEVEDLEKIAPQLLMDF
ncbi:centromere protein X [Sphaerosporella brunnea]|uniref:Centromere protein X n=1 Tax=Sphaerosporella brunnea TaxID=1250544 RepID=A0A5J5F532_9PEZI|nr:centromere protein X [Sphaerosporella brunnea]